MKFLLENNLSKLAKWLRFLGHDVKVLEGEINLGELSKNQDRAFITTSKRWETTLKRMGINYLVVPRHDWELQLCAVIKHFNLSPELCLSRCAYCGACVSVCKNDANELVETFLVIDESKCNCCGLCVKVCPMNALSVETSES